MPTIITVATTSSSRSTARIFYCGSVTAVLMIAALAGGGGGAGKATAFRILRPTTTSTAAAARRTPLMPPTNHGQIYKRNQNSLGSAIFIQQQQYTTTKRTWLHAAANGQNDGNSNIDRNFNSPPPTTGWSKVNTTSTINSNNNTRTFRPPNRPPRRRFSTADEDWEVPISLDIPIEKIDMSFTRSSGAGGQNVNKVNTKVELRFNVMEAEWIPLEVRERLYQQQRSRINKNGFMSIQSQEFRTQEKNRKSAVSKLQGLILQAYPRPKERKMRTGVSKATKERNKEMKKRRSAVKQSRRVDSKDW